MVPWEVRPGASTWQVKGTLSSIWRRHPPVSGRYSTEARTMPETVAHSLPGLFSCEARLTAYLNDAQNVRTGIRNDSLLGLLLTDGDICYGLKAVDRISFELKLHNRPLPYKSSRRGLGRRAGSAIPLWDHYMYRQGQICHPQKRTQCPLGPRITSGQTASAADPADIWENVPRRCP